MIIVTLITIYTTRLLLEGLGIEDYGIYNVTIGIITLCSFLRPAMANGIQRFYNYEIGKKDFQKARQVFNTGLQIQLLVTIIIVFLCETAGLWYMCHKLVVSPERFDAAIIVFQISVLAFIISMIEVPFMAAVMGHEKMDFFAFISILDAVLKLGIAFLLSFSDIDHLVLYGFLLLVVEFLNLFLYVCYSVKNFNEIRISRKVHKELFVPMLSFSGWNLLDKIARVGKDQGVNLILNFYFGPIVNAARGIVNQVSYAFTGLIDSAITASRPQAIQSYAAGNAQRTIKMMISLSKFTVLFLYLLVYPIYLESDYILHIWLGNNIPNYTIPFLNITLLIIVADKLSTSSNLVVHASGKMKKYNIVSGVMNLLVVPAVLLGLISGMDVVTTYWIVLVFTIITQTMYMYVLKSIVSFSLREYFYEVVCRSVIVVVVSFVFPYFIHSIVPEGFIRLLLVVVSTFIFCGVAVLFFGLTLKEKELCFSLIKDFRNKIHLN